MLGRPGAVDLADRWLGQPVHRLLGATPDKLSAYASTMCGDELPGGLARPENYATFAIQCRERGCTAFKPHTWMPPSAWAPDPRKDVAACRAVAEAVGADMRLMLDSFHFYSREEALFIGRELEQLDFYWLGEPMDEHSMSAYLWLAKELSILIVGPESAEGKQQTRAEWIVHGASDIRRGGWDVCGITPLMKIAHLCEAFGVCVEIDSSIGNLHCCAQSASPANTMSAASCTRSWITTSRRPCCARCKGLGARFRIIELVFRLHIICCGRVPRFGGNNENAVCRHHHYSGWNDMAVLNYQLIWFCLDRHS